MPFYCCQQYPSFYFRSGKQAHFSIGIHVTTMTQRNGKQPPKKNGKQARNTLPDASPISGTPPPEEHRWKAGDPSPNPKGRPRNLGQLRELIQQLGNETITQQGLTRLEALLRGMFAGRSASDKLHVLEYGFGKVPQPIEIHDWREEARREGYDPERLFTRLVEAGRAAMDGAGEGGSVAHNSTDENSAND
jgi:hypothetical protein